MKNRAWKLLVTDFARAFVTGTIVYIGISVADVLRDRFMPNIDSYLLRNSVTALLPLIIIYLIVYLMNNVLRFFNQKEFYRKSEKINFLKIIGIIIGLFFWPMVISFLKFKLL